MKSAKASQKPVNRFYHEAYEACEETRSHCLKKKNFVKLHILCGLRVNNPKQSTRQIFNEMDYKDLDQAALACALRAATPGSVLPSSHSRKAPPADET